MCLQQGKLRLGSNATDLVAPNDNITSAALVLHRILLDTFEDTQNPALALQAT
jgi:hypothetical protein